MSPASKSGGKSKAGGGAGAGGVGSNSQNQPKAIMTRSQKAGLQVSSFFHFQSLF